MRVVWVSLVLGATLVTGCLPKMSDARMKVAAGCDISKLKDHEKYEAVVKVTHYLNAQKTSSSTCTGTWVSDQTLLTARHCLPKKDEKVFVIPAGSKEQVWSEQIKTNNENNSNSDIAVVLFPRGTFKGEPLAIDTSLMSGTDGPQSAQNLSKSKSFIIGYGKTDHENLDSAGKKTFGYVDQLRWDDDNKSWSFKGYKSANLRANSATNGECTSAANSQGDSGGPLINNGIIIGVSSSHSVDGIYIRGIYASTAFNIDMIYESKFPVRGLTEGEYQGGGSKSDSSEGSRISDQGSGGRDDGLQSQDRDNPPPNDRGGGGGGGGSGGRREDFGGSTPSTSSCACGLSPQGVCMVTRSGMPIASTPLFGASQCRDECLFLREQSFVRLRCQ